MSAEQPVEGPTERLVSVLVDQLTVLQAPALPLPDPQERRLRRITHLKREDIRIQEITLTSDQQVPWHYHSEIRDTFLVLEGEMTLYLQNPKESVSLSPGDSFVVEVGRPHLVANGGQDRARFLVLQGVGDYDYVPLA